MKTEAQIKALLNILESLGDISIQLNVAKKVLKWVLT